MKTILPEAIKTIAQAKDFLSDLVRNGEMYHPEDDAHDIDWQTCETPTAQECDQLNKLMDDIYDLPGNDGRHCEGIAFDPCEYLIRHF